MPWECYGARNWQQVTKDKWKIKMKIFIFFFKFRLTYKSPEKYYLLLSVQFTQSCPTPCDCMNRNIPGLPVHHQLPDFTQTHVHRVGDAIQQSHPLSSSPPPAPNPSQHQGVFQWVNSAWDGQSIGVLASPSVLPMNTQDWSPLGWTGWISLQSKGLSRVSLNTTVQKHQFFSASIQTVHSRLYMTTGKTIALTRQTLLAK